MYLFVSADDECTMEIRDHPGRDVQI